MLWGCFAASGTGGLDRITGIMKSEDYQAILEGNVLPSVRKLGLRRRSWVLQQDKDPNHTSKSTQDWLKGKKWTAMSPDLNPIENIWGELKSAIGERTLQMFKNLSIVQRKCVKKYHPRSARSLQMAIRNFWRLSSLPKGVQPNIANVSAHAGFQFFCLELQYLR